MDLIKRKNPQVVEVRGVEINVIEKMYLQDCCTIIFSTHFHSAG